jgi:hypothetical protein
MRVDMTVLLMPPLAVLAAMFTTADPASQTSVVLTQVDQSGTDIGQRHVAVCNVKGCLAVFPVAFPEGVCIVAVQVSPPDHASIISLDIDRVTCVPARPDLSFDLIAPSWAKLDCSRAVTQIIKLHLGTAMHDFTPSGEPPSLLRLDAVFPPPLRR